MRKRPVGVTIIAVVEALSALVLLAAGIASAVGGSQPGSMAAVNAAMLGLSPRTLAAVLLAGAVVSAVLAAGLFHQQEWGRVGTIIVSVGAAIGTVLALTLYVEIVDTNAIVAAGVKIALYLLIIFYLSRRKVRAVFREQPPADVRIAA